METISQFNSKFGEIKKEILSHNRLIWEIVMYLTCLETGDEQAGFILIKLIFGKSAAELFLKQGINNTLMDQRITLFKNLRIQTKMRLVTPPKSPSRSSSRILNTPQKIKGSLLTVDGASQTEHSYHKSNTPNPQNRQFIQNVDNFEILNKVISLMKIYGIPMRYIEHWLWLFRFSHCLPNKFLSFHDLLCNVYNLDPRNDHPDFQQILQGVSALRVSDGFLRGNQ